MGRAMLIIVTGLLISLGYTFLGMSDQRSLLSSQSTNSANKSMTKNMAHTGIGFAINEFKENDSWEKNTTKTKNINGGTIEYSWDETTTPNTVKVTATSTLNNTDNTVVALFEQDPPIDLSMVPGAMGVYDQDTEVQINGNPPQIDGRNYDMDASAPNGDQDSYKSGVSGVNDEGDTFKFSGSSNEEGGDYIEGDPRYNQDSNLDGQGWNDEVINKYEPNAEEYNGDLGSKTEPKIVTVSGGDETASGNGAGVLIIEDGASFTLSGDKSYYGLIIIRGNLKISGSPTIYGSLIFADNSSVDIEEDPTGVYSGTPDVRYSEESLQNVNKNLTLANSGSKLVSMYN